MFHVLPIPLLRLAFSLDTYSFSWGIQANKEALHETSLLDSEYKNLQFYISILAFFFLGGFFFSNIDQETECPIWGVFGFSVCIQKYVAVPKTSHD
jgi:hypothetical protein